MKSVGFQRKMTRGFHFSKPFLLPPTPRPTQNSLLVHHSVTFHHLRGPSSYRSLNPCGADMAVHHLLRRGVSGGSSIRGILLASQVLVLAHCSCGHTGSSIFIQLSFSSPAAQEIGRRPLSSAAAGDAAAELRGAREDVKKLLKTTFCHPILVRYCSLCKICGSLWFSGWSRR